LILWKSRPAAVREWNLRTRGRFASALTRQKYLYNGVTVAYPPLMTDDELALVLEVFVEEVRDRPLKKRHRRCGAAPILKIEASRLACAGEVY
jgi:hypothetical protein